jgi:MFS family permease
VSRPRMSPTWAAVCVTTAGMLPVYLLGGLAVQVREEFDLDRAAIGLLVAVFFGTAALGSLPAGRAADRLGAASTMRVSALVAAVSLGVAALSPSVGVLVAALVLAGVANGGGQPASNALISRAVAPDRRGLAYGAKQAAIPAAVLLGGLSVPVFGVTVGWRWAFAAGAVLALVVAATVPTPPGSPPPAKRAATRAMTEMRSAAAGPYGLLPLAVLGAGALLGAAVGNAFGAFYVDTAADSGVSPSLAGTSAAVGSALGIGTRIAAGALADRRTGRYFMMVAAMMSVGFLACLLMATGSAALMFPAAALAYGLGWAWAGLFTHAVTLTHPHDPGRATGITQGGVALGGAAGPLAFGQLAEAGSLGAAWLATGVCALLAAATVLTGRALLLRRRPALVAHLRGESVRT